MIYNHTFIKEMPVVLQQEKVEEPSKLIVHNDEVNTFDWVIRSLVEICKHTHQQAEQCAWIIHFSGKYPVKKGPINLLRPMRQALVDRGIGATIED